MAKYTSYQVPIARIAVNKNEQKVYENGKIYLKNGKEFQIMLFNPTHDTVFANILLNNNSIGGVNTSGLILRPGERIWLERYLNDAKKFKFTTYLADNSNEGKKAIEHNGNVKIEFFREYVIPTFVPISNGTTTITTPYWYYYLNDTSGGHKYDNIGLSTNVSTNLTRKLLLDSIQNTSVETGIIEKGSQSKQEFISEDKQFEIIPFHTINYKLLPISQKIFVSSEDLKVRFCDDCGKKIRNTKAKYCSSCGNKL